MLHAFANWIQNMPWALWLSSSTWAYPFIQLTHFTGLSLWIGTTFALDLRLLGVGKKPETASQLLDALIAWNWIGFGIVVLGGFLLFSTAATSFVMNEAFRVKVGMLIPVALLWHLIVQWKTRQWGQTEKTPGIAKFAGLLEMLLWISVATAAVSIPFF